MESTTVNDGSTRTPSRVHVHDGTSTRDVQQIYVHDGVAARLVFIRYTAPSLNKSGNVSGSCSTSTQYDCTATTGSVTCTVSDGRAPYTYAWSYVSGSSATVNSPTAATTTFSRNAAGSAGGTQYVGTYRCTVTDAKGGTAYVDVTVTTTHTSTYVPSLSASASVGSVSGSGSSGVPGANINVTTGSVTVTPSGGTAPYSYSWSYVSGTSASVGSAASATTSFSRSATGSNGGTNYVGTYRCTVTDNGGLTASVDVTVSTTHTNTYVTLGASASGSASGSCSTNNGNGCSSTTNSVTVTASNGAAPYTYSWAWVSGDTFTINSPTSASTSFSKTAAGSALGTTYSGTYRCTVTDNYGYTATADVSVSTTHTDTYTTLGVTKNTDAYGSCSYTSGNCTATTNYVYATVSGGLGPYSFSWSYLSGTSASVALPSADVTNFSRTSTGTTTLGGWYRCTVTDATSRTAYVDVYVQTTHTLSYTPMSLSKDGDSYGSFSCTPDPPFVTCPLKIDVTGNSVTVSVSGGTGPFSYSWSQLNGDTSTVSAPTSATTWFTMKDLYQGNYNAATWRCTVTDSTSATAYIDVFFSADYVSGL